VTSLYLLTLDILLCVWIDFVYGLLPLVSLNLSHLTYRFDY